MTTVRSALNRYANIYRPVYPFIPIQMTTGEGSVSYLSLNDRDGLFRLCLTYTLSRSPKEIILPAKSYRRLDGRTGNYRFVDAVVA